MALISNKDWLKLAGQERAGKDRKAEKLQRVGKSEKMDFKAQKKLIAKRESALKWWEGVKLMTVLEWCVSGA